MHKCEFCSATYQPRPQVKHPRACFACQKRRQRANEKAWHSKHKGQFNSKYFRIQRDLRTNALKQKAAEFKRWVEVGRKFLGPSGTISGLEEFLIQFFTYLGVRRVNKLCQGT